MRLLLIAAAVAMAGPAMAGTLEEITTHGMVIVHDGQPDIELKFTPDGKFTAMGGVIQGTWKIDGDKLCTRSNVEQGENCVAYPKGLKSGESFQATDSTGPITIKIK